MRLVIQRVKRAHVDVHGERVGEIGNGLLALVGFGAEDGETLPGSRAWQMMQDKLLNLRIFSDDDDKMNLSLKDTGGDLLLVSQFTLYASCRKGRRPSFTGSCQPDLARALFDRFVEEMRELAPAKVETGSFGEEMDVELVNWGPVTIVLDSQDFL